MKRIIGSVAICVLLQGVSIQAQAPQGPPKPGPEVKRLEYFVGNWKEEGKSTAHGMTGTVSSTQKWEWVSGGFFIVGHSDNKSPVGDFKIMAVLGYDPETKMYTYSAFDSWGELITAKGNVSGDTWTWITVTMMQGKPMKTRLTEKEVSKTQYTLKYESSTDGGNTWTSDLESTFTKVVARSHDRSCCPASSYFPAFKSRSSERPTENGWLRESCEVCRKEDLALKVGEVPRPASAEIG